MISDFLNRRAFMKLTGAALAGARLLQAEAEPQRDYEVEVNGKPVPVYVIQSQWHDKKYSAAYFDFSGAVTVRIKPNLSALGIAASLDHLAVRPEKYAFTLRQ